MAITCFSFRECPWSCNGWDADILKGLLAQHGNTKPTVRWVTNLLKIQVRFSRLISALAQGNHYMFYVWSSWLQSHYWKIYLSFAKTLYSSLDSYVYDMSCSARVRCVDIQNRFLFTEMSFFLDYLYTNMLTCRQWWPFSSQTHHHASMAWGSDDVMTTVRWFDNTTVIVGRRWRYSLRCLAFGLLLLWNHCLSNQELKMGFYDVRIYDKTDSNNLQG